MAAVVNFSFKDTDVFFVQGGPYKRACSSLLVQKRLFSEETSNDFNCIDQYGSTPSQSDEDDEGSKEDTRNSLELSSLAPITNKISHGCRSSSRRTQPNFNAPLQLSPVSAEFIGACASSNLDPLTMDYHSNNKCSDLLPNSYTEKQCHIAGQTRDQYSKRMLSKGHCLPESPSMSHQMKTTFSGSKTDVIRGGTRKKPEAPEYGLKDMRQTLITHNQNSAKKLGSICGKEKGKCMVPSKEMYLDEENCFFEPLTSTPLPSPRFESPRDLELHTSNCEAKEYLIFNSDPQTKNTKSCLGLSCDISFEKLDCQAGGTQQHQPTSLDTSTLVFSETLVLRKNENPVNEKLQVGSFAEQLGLAPLLTKPLNQCSLANRKHLLGATSFLPPSQRPTSAKAKLNLSGNNMMVWVNSSDPKSIPTNSRVASPKSVSNQQCGTHCDSMKDLTCHEIQSPTSYYDKRRGVSQPRKNYKPNVVFPWEISPITSPVQVSRMQEKSHSCESTTQCSGVFHGTQYNLDESKMAHFKKDVCEVKVNNLLPSYQIQCATRVASCDGQDSSCSAKPSIFSLGDCKGTGNMTVCRQDWVHYQPKNDISGTRAEIPASSLHANQQHAEHSLGIGSHIERSLANCCKEDEATENGTCTCCTCQSLESWNVDDCTFEKKKSVQDLHGLTSHNDESDPVSNMLASPVGLKSQDRIEQRDINIVTAIGSQHQEGRVTKKYKKQDKFKYNKLNISTPQTNLTSSHCKPLEQSTDYSKSACQSTLAMKNMHMVSQSMVHGTKYNCSTGPQYCPDQTVIKVEQNQINVATMSCSEQKKDSMQQQTCSHELQFNSEKEVLMLCDGGVETGDQRTQTAGSELLLENAWLALMDVASQEVVCHSEMMCSMEVTKDVQDELVSDLDQDSVQYSNQCHSFTAMPQNGSSSSSPYTDLAKSDTATWMEQSCKHKKVHLMSPSATGHIEANPDINQEYNFKNSEIVMVNSSTSTRQDIRQAPRRVETQDPQQFLPLKSCIQQDDKETVCERGKCQPTAPEKNLDQDSHRQKCFADSYWTPLDERKPEHHGSNWDNNLSLHRKPDINKEPEPNILGQLQMLSPGHHVSIDAGVPIPLSKVCPLGCVGVVYPEVHSNLTNKDVDLSEAPNGVNISPPRVPDKLSDMHSQDLGSKRDTCDTKCVLTSPDGSQDQNNSHVLKSFLETCYTFADEKKQDNQEQKCHTFDLSVPSNLKSVGNENKDVNQEPEPNTMRQSEIELQCYNVLSEGTLPFTLKSRFGCLGYHFQNVLGEFTKEGEFLEIDHSKDANSGSASSCKVPQKLPDTQSQELKAARGKCNGKGVSPALEGSQEQVRCGHKCDPSPSLNQQPFINKDDNGPAPNILRQFCKQYSNDQMSSHADKTILLTKGSKLGCLEPHLHMVCCNLTGKEVCLDTNDSTVSDGGNTSPLNIPERSLDMFSEVVGSQRDNCNGNWLPSPSKGSPHQITNSDGHHSLPEICCTLLDEKKQEKQKLCGHNCDLCLLFNIKSVENMNKDVKKDPELKIQEQIQIQSLSFHVSNDVKEETIPSTKDRPMECKKVNFRQVHCSLNRLNECLSADHTEIPLGGKTCPPKKLHVFLDIYSQGMEDKGGNHSCKLILPFLEGSQGQDRNSSMPKGVVESFCTFLDESVQVNQEHQHPSCDLSPSLNIKLVKGGGTYINKEQEPKNLGVVQMQASHYLESINNKVTFPLKKENSLWYTGVHYRQVFGTTSTERRYIDHVEGASGEKTSLLKVLGKFADMQFQDTGVERGTCSGEWVYLALDGSQEKDNSSAEHKGFADTYCTLSGESKQYIEESWGHTCEPNPSAHIKPVEDDSKDVYKELAPETLEQLQIQSSCFHVSSDAEKEFVPLAKENPLSCVRVHFQQACSNLSTEEKCLDVAYCGCPDGGKQNLPKLPAFLPDVHRQETGEKRIHSKWTPPSEGNQNKDSHGQRSFAPVSFILSDGRKKENQARTQNNCVLRVSLNQKPVEDRSKVACKEPKTYTLQQFQIAPSRFHVLSDEEEEYFPATKESPLGCLKFHFKQVHRNIIKIDKSLNADLSEASHGGKRCLPNVPDVRPDMHSQYRVTMPGKHFGKLEFPSSGGIQDQDKNSHQQKASIEEIPKQKFQGQIQMKSSFYHVLSDKEETTHLRKENPMACLVPYFQQAHSCLTKEDSSIYVDNSVAPNDVSKSPSKVLDKHPDMHRCLMLQNSANSSGHCTGSVGYCEKRSHEEDSMKHISPMGKQTFPIFEPASVIADPVITLQDLFSVHDVSPIPCSFSSSASFKEEERKEDPDLSQFSKMMIEKLHISDGKHLSGMSMSSPTNETEKGMMMTGYRKPEGVCMSEMGFANYGQDNATILAEYTCYQTLYHRELSVESGQASAMMDHDTLDSLQHSRIQTRHKKRLMRAQPLRRSKRLKRS